MNKPMSRVGFKLMTFVFRIRDFLRPRMDLLEEAGIEPGFCILDYGCGPGSYMAPLAQLVGISGKIYALDLHPLAIKDVQKIAAQKSITNIKTIESDCNTGLPDNHVDVVLLYD
ncbi:MAG: methyltransferase domain-containing protein, partial [Desulfobacterales bacterium]